MRILLVEDDVQLARQIASALTEAGHDPIIVHDGERALDKAKETPFDLIVLDIILPGMDGFGVLRYLRSQHMASRVLMLTAKCCNASARNTSQAVYCYSPRAALWMIE